MIFDQLLEASAKMEIPEKLRYNFEEFILYFYINREFHSFANTSLFHIPPELREKLPPNYFGGEKRYHQKLAEIFTEGMDQGIICKGDAWKMVWSFKAMRDGAHGWICASPELNEKSIQSFWNHFWFGVAERGTVNE